MQCALPLQSSRRISWNAFSRALAGCRGTVLSRDSELGRSRGESPLQRWRRVVVAAADAPFRGRVRLKKLRGTPWVANQDESDFRSLIRRAHEKAERATRISVEAIGVDLELVVVIARHRSGARREGRAPQRSAWRDKVKVLDVPEVSGTLSVMVVHHLPPGASRRRSRSLPLRYRRLFIDACGRVRVRRIGPARKQVHNRRSVSGNST